MSLNVLLIVLFTMVMTANVIALVRHYMLLRMMTIALNGFVEQQRWFNEVMNQQGFPSLAPDDTTTGNA